MIKGVNHQVVEVNDTQCPYFERILFFVNPEYAAVMEKGIPYLSRAELLGQLMKNYRLPVAISGTHGKTTTTSMLSEILLAADADPTLSVGGILPSIGGNVRVGGSNYFVAEACEYTNSFLSMFPKIGIILNIEEDHLDFFKDLADIRHSFHRFSGLVPEDGAVIINTAIENWQEIVEGTGCRIIPIGMEAPAEPADGSAASDQSVQTDSHSGISASRFRSSSSSPSARRAVSLSHMGRSWRSTGSMPP